MQAYTKINSFNEASSIYTWLYAIAKNLCLRQLEQRKKISFASLEELLQIGPSQGSPDNFTLVERQYYIGQVKEGCLLGLLRCLSFYQRIAFIMNVLLEVKVKDVAVIIDKSETATGLLIHRAKSNIKEFLCKNCSLYDVDNPCHCENLIDFSLKQGWIHKKPDQNFGSASNIDIETIENEINSLKKITLLYKNLPDQPLPDDVYQRTRKEIQKQTSQIFSMKKVK